MSYLKPHREKMGKHLVFLKSCTIKFMLICGHKLIVLYKSNKVKS